MLSVVSALLAFVASLFRSRGALALPVLALQHQGAVYNQTIPRPRLRPTARLCWVGLSRLWPGWQDARPCVQPRTVIAWPQQRFRAHGQRGSQRGQRGRPPLAKARRTLLRDMWQSNPTWGAPRLVGELRTLGIAVAKSTGETYRIRPKKPPAQTWKTLLKHHVQDLVSLDFLVVPPVPCRVLCMLVILAPERRRVVHFHVTAHPTAQWTAPQVVAAFPWTETPRALLHDRDSLYGAAFRQRGRHRGIEEVVIAPGVRGKIPTSNAALGVFAVRGVRMSWSGTSSLCSVSSRGIVPTLIVCARPLRWRWIVRKPDPLSHPRTGRWAQSRREEVSLTIMSGERHAWAHFEPLDLVMLQVIGNHRRAPSQAIGAETPPLGG